MRWDNYSSLKNSYMNIYITTGVLYLYVQQNCVLIGWSNFLKVIKLIDYKNKFVVSVNEKNKFKYVLII